jgi:predicted DNA-binding transcriptional regulator
MSKPKQTSAYSNVEETLQKLKDIAVLNKEIESLKNQLKDKDVEIAALKRAGPKSDLTVQRLDVSSEQVIAETQLKLLEDKALSGHPLSLEEIRIYDLLVKNKRLAMGESTENASFRVLPPDMGDAELLRIAQTNEKKDDH